MKNIKVLEFGEMSNKIKSQIDISSDKFKQNSLKFQKFLIQIRTITFARAKSG